MTKLYYQSQTSPICLDFRDLSFSVPQKNNESKLILKNVSGRFKSGQLTAILGPSGAGKSTLLNILAGYRFQQTKGTIFVNGQKRQENRFRNISRYIMQENWIQPLLSVKESMLVAASLKLGRNAKPSEKLETITEILHLLGLSASEETPTDKLSGGELKRLFIALELISNPSVLFLDEPTSGLDDVAAYQCIVLLKKLAETGRTIICSIHAPSARVFSCFDNSYFISSGQCVYQGCGSELVSFLSKMETPCPVQFNPADYILELCSGGYEELEQEMVSVIKNGKNLFEDKAFVPVGKVQEGQSKIFQEETNLEKNFWNEFKVLLLRSWLLEWKNRKYLIIKAICSVLMAICVGTLYFNVNEDATRTHLNFTLFLICIVIFMYIPAMPLLLQIPTDMKYLKREHFNRWYNIKPFFCALTVSTLPDQIVFGSLFLAPLYILTAQPLEFYRILGFCGVFILIQNIMEGYALIIGSSMNVTNSLFFGLCIIVVPTIGAIFGRGEEYSDISVFTLIMMYSSFVRYGLEALMVLMLSGRTLKCPEDVEFCMFTDQDYFLKKMAMDQIPVWVDVLLLIVTLIFMKYIGYYSLKQRLRPNKVFKFVKSKLKIKITN